MRGIPTRCSGTRKTYSNKASFMRVQFKGIRESKKDGVIVFAVTFGKILDLKNYKRR